MLGMARLSSEERVRGDKYTRMAISVCWEIVNGPIPKGLLVCHHCDDPKCCNPSHLFLGTVKDNYDDMVSKNRRVIVYGSAILTEKQVVEIREKSATGNFSRQEMAKEYGVDTSTITDIVNGRAWKHLAGPVNPIAQEPIRVHLTKDRVIEIIEKYATGGYTKEDLAKEYSTVQCNIRNILSGRTWKQVNRPPYPK